jgi:hypothetical protein
MISVQHRRQSVIRITKPNDATTAELCIAFIFDELHMRNPRNPA